MAIYLGSFNKYYGDSPLGKGIFYFRIHWALTGGRPLVFSPCKVVYKSLAVGFRSSVGIPFNNAHMGEATYCSSAVQGCKISGRHRQLFREVFFLNPETAKLLELGFCKDLCRSKYADWSSCKSHSRSQRKSMGSAVVRFRECRFSVSAMLRAWPWWSGLPSKKAL